MTKKPERKGRKHKNPITRRTDKSGHSDPERPMGRERPPKGEDPRKKRFEKGDDGFSASG